MQSFRASPWVSYDPSATAQHTRDSHLSGSEMDEDVDMEAPSISILKDEDTPPPVHRKAAANPRKRPAPSAATSADIRRGGNRGDGEGEDEEDQLVDELIDDDSVDPTKDASRSIGDSSQKRKAPAKKKARKEKKTGDGDKKGKDRLTTLEAGGHSIAPTTSIFKANPSEPGDDVGSPASMAGGIELATKGRKKATPRKHAASRAKLPAKVAKPKLPVPNLIVEDTGALSESYAGTAASSPVTGTFEPNTPEPELPPSSPAASVVPPLEEPPNLENVAVPIYPLPTKPFPVQPPQKLPTGFAQIAPIEKSGKKPRHWREAKREIRGIAGGRWLVKSWVGDKDSELATHLAAVSSAQAQAKLVEDQTGSAAVALPKLPVLSAASVKKSSSKLKGSSKAGSTATSANPSRAPSVAPDGPVNLPSSAVKAPSKMRISQQAPSAADDFVVDS